MPPPTSLILATRNAGKLVEFRHLLADLNLEVIGLDAFPTVLPVRETETTFEPTHDSKRARFRPRPAGGSLRMTPAYW